MPCSTPSAVLRGLGPALFATLLLLTAGRPAEAASGGPDASGTTWHDAADGCAPQVDGGTLAESTGFWDGGLLNFVGPFELGFALPFHDIVTTQVWVHRSGLVFFQPPPDLPLDLPQSIPTLDAAGGFLAPYWETWDEASQASGAVGWEQFPGYFKLSWTARLTSNGSEVRWELYAYPDGSLRVEYLDVGAGPHVGTIGMESPDQSTGLEVLREGVSEDSSYIHGMPEPFAICFQPPAGCGAGVLGCNSVTSGDTRGAASALDSYACTGLTYDGPEEVYTFVNPTTQVVSFGLEAADSNLDILLLDACDPGSCLAFGDTGLEQELGPGTYQIVVDGRGGAAGAYELTVVCGYALEPSILRINGAEGECFDERKTAWLTPDIPQADVLFAIDLTGSMGEERSQLQTNMQTIIDRLELYISDVAFGLVHYRDYDAAGVASVPCAYDASTFGAAGDYPYQLAQPITSSRAVIQAAVDGLPVVGGGGDAPESYTRALYEAVHDSAIAWRAGSRRIVVNFGDELPHDCNVLACLGAVSGTRRGVDLGRDGAPGGGDDLRIVEVIQELVDARISLVHLDSGEAAFGGRKMDGIYTYTQIWDCWAARTGGVAQELARDGTVPSGIDLAELIGDVIEEQSARCSVVELQAEAGFEDWLASVSPVEYLDVNLPTRLDFDIRICVPAGTPPGLYSFRVRLLCAGGFVAFQQVTVDVGLNCAPAVVAGPTDQRICLGETARLDASGLSLVNCEGDVEYEWRDELGNPAGTGAVVDVAPTGSATYTVELSCSTDPDCGISDMARVTVDVPPVLASASARDINDCNLGIEVSWSAAQFPSGSGVYHVYRSESSCADALSRPPLLEGTSLRSWNDRSTASEATYFYVVEAEDSDSGTTCLPTGPAYGGAVARACVEPPVQDLGTASFPDGVYAELFARHEGQEVSFYWDGARALLPGESFRMLKASGHPTESWATVNPPDDLSRSFTETDTASARQFFDLRVANECDDLSLDEFPPSF